MAADGNGGRAPGPHRLHSQVLPDAVHLLVVDLLSRLGGHDDRGQRPGDRREDHHTFVASAPQPEVIRAGMMADSPWLLRGL